MKTTRGHIAVLEEGLTTKGESQVTEEASRGGGVLGPMAVPTRSSAEEEQSLAPPTPTLLPLLPRSSSEDAAGWRLSSPSVKVGLEGLRWTCVAFKV